MQHFLVNKIRLVPVINGNILKTRLLDAFCDLDVHGLAVYYIFDVLLVRVEYRSKTASKTCKMCIVYLVAL